MMMQPLHHALTGNNSLPPISIHERKDAWRRQHHHNNAEDDDAAAAVASSSMMMKSASSSSHRRRPDHSNVNLYLFSLEYTLDDDYENFSPIVTKVWRWKDTVLGDGRDFFVPKPRTLSALQYYLLQGSTEHSQQEEFEEAQYHDDEDRVDEDDAVVIQECVVLSNCARFEILLFVEEDTTTATIGTATTSSSDDSRDMNAILARRLSSLLLRQVQSYYQKQQGNSNLLTQLIPGDWPSMINLDAATTTTAYGEQQDDDEAAAAEVDELSRYWTVYKGPQEVAEHLTLVAAGMASRPRRPNRHIVFQPFSSRDAHILLQLKRTYEIATIRSISNPNKTNGSAKSPSSSSSYVLATLLQYALRAGKSARNPRECPDLWELKGTPSRAVSQRVKEVVRTLVLDPIVLEFVDHWMAMQNAKRIAQFRAQAMSLVGDHNDNSSAQLRYIQQQIHAPTVKMRKGQFVDQTEILRQLQVELAQQHDEG